MEPLPDKEFFKTIMKKVRDIPFSYVIKMTTGHEVIPLSGNDDDVVDEIYQRAKEVLIESRNEDFSALRPNEISNKLEDMLRRKLAGEIPENKSAGYPNIMIIRKNKVYYLEVKLAGERQLESNLRAFYYEPVELAKVKWDASHILVGFFHESKSIVGFKLIDLSKINVGLKSEFNTNNIELYKNEAVIKSYP